MVSNATGRFEPRSTEVLVISPLNLRTELNAAIDREIANAHQGLPAAIWIKCNQVTDQAVIDKLYEASQAGVEIDLVAKQGTPILNWIRPDIIAVYEDVRQSGRELAKAVIARIDGVAPELLQSISDKQPIQIGVRVAGRKFDQVLFGVVNLSDAQSAQLGQCLTEWSNSVLERYKAK